MSKEPKCACGRKASHEIWKPGSDTPEYLCCECHVKAGHAPTDWHYECMVVVGRGEDTVDWDAA